MCMYVQGMSIAGRAACDRVDRAAVVLCSGTAALNDDVTGVLTASWIRIPALDDVASIDEENDTMESNDTEVVMSARDQLIDGLLNSSLDTGQSARDLALKQLARYRSVCT